MARINVSLAQIVCANISTQINLFVNFQMGRLEYISFFKNGNFDPYRITKYRMLMLNHLFSFTHSIIISAIQEKLLIVTTSTQLCHKLKNKFIFVVILGQAT